VANRVQWFLVVASLLWNTVGGPLTSLPITDVLFVIALPFMLIHGLRRYGFRALAVFMVGAYAISNLYENCSILTGFPFGHYYYTGGPKLFLVPVSIGPFYISIGYLSWQTANALLGITDVRLNRSPNLVLLPALAAAVMTMFDLTTDPVASTIEHAWIWENGGGYYGVPATNFLGWWLCTYSFFQVFAAYLWRSYKVRTAPQRRQFWLQPVILYFNLGLVAFVNFLTAHGGTDPVTARNGVVWRPEDIREGTMTVFLFTMFVVTVLALARIHRSEEPVDE
jgi:uncharacterized membrane protein